jgi:hypothetical protein
VPEIAIGEDNEANIKGAKKVKKGKKVKLSKE